MFSTIFHTLFYNPIYNALIFFIGVVPFADMGMAIILVTVVVKLILFPLSKKAVRTQMVMKRIEPELKALRKKFEDNKQEQAKMMMELYRENKINPLSSFLTILLQLPVIFALYWVFLKGGLPDIKIDILYSFIPSPSEINMVFLGMVDITKKSIIIAALAGITQYYQFKLTLPPLEKRNDNATLKEDLARSMQINMKYMMPGIVFVFAYWFSAAIALYWLTSNIFAIGQELVIRKQVKEKYND